MRSATSRQPVYEPQTDAWREIASGLGQTPRRLPSKLFYDARGSLLFERITELPEYYLARVERQILRDNLGEITSLLGCDRALVELGSGASQKTRLLLDALPRPIAYVPIDISASALVSSVAALRAEYPRLVVRPLVADYTRPLRLPLVAEGVPLSVFFPGSTIGNLSPAEAGEFLARLRREWGPRQRWLIGVDTPKEAWMLEAAYADAQGVTAAFNRNLLHVLNREYAANFSPSEFEHRALWQPSEGRIEMQLVSGRRQVVSVGPHTFTLEAGEPIVTEHCYKYAPQAFRELAEQAGFVPRRVWTDSSERFSLHLLEAHWLDASAGQPA
ncbi:MAG TPA: L-histidine N(alpha)-methyltransferase [Polyangiaceae bacterium]|nr:L-histidine N(alpha)-methyltransferase [Polyangiaceae bacterium]